MSLASGLRRSIFRTAPTAISRVSVRPAAHQVFSKPITASFNNFTSTRYFSATMASSGVHNLMAKADFDTARGESSLMVVDFFATWCGPCKAIAPQVVKLSNTYTNARFYKIDVDEVPEVAQELSIRAMPTFVLFKNGEEVATVVGANPSALEAAIKQHA